MWWSTKKNALINSGLFNSYTDIHSHILPGVDDGIQSMDGSLAALNSFEKLGVEAMFLTPHINEFMPNEEEVLRVRFAELKSAYSGNIKLRLAAEYMLDSVFVQRLERGGLLTIIDDHHILVETSYFNPPINFKRLLAQTMSVGLHPILAHPERYNYMNLNDYTDLKALGVKFQLNLGSMLGVYGRTVKRRAEWLLKNGMYDFSGSDTHSMDHFTASMTNLKIDAKYIDMISLLKNNG